MISVTTPPLNMRMTDGIRPVNIQTDLAPLADLIELAFRETMDESGRAAIREMRYMSKLGFGLKILPRLNDLVLGISQGYVAIVDGKLVGNVSLYPASWRREIGKAWMFANVSTHPDYRKQGIARDLMDRSMEFIHSKGATHAILQVDYDNKHAIHLYESLEFVRERAFTKWVRTALVSAPARSDELDDIFFTQARRSDWKQEYTLIEATRPNERGGIGWLQPLHMKDFRPTLWSNFKKILSFGDKEKLIVRDEETSELLTLLWIERSMALSRTRLTLFNQADSERHNAEALLSSVLRRYRTSGFSLEHPYDDRVISDLLTQYRFRPHRTVWHMIYAF